MVIPDKPFVEVYDIDYASVTGYGELGRLMTEYYVEDIINTNLINTNKWMTDKNIKKIQKWFKPLMCNKGCGWRITKKWK